MFFNRHFKKFCKLDEVKNITGFKKASSWVYFSHTMKLYSFDSKEEFNGYLSGHPELNIETCVVGLDKDSNFGYVISKNVTNFLADFNDTRRFANIGQNGKLDDFLEAFVKAQELERIRVLNKKRREKIEVEQKIEARTAEEKRREEQEAAKKIAEEEKRRKEEEEERLRKEEAEKRKYSKNYNMMDI